MSYHVMPAIAGQVGDEGLKAFPSSPLFPSLKPISANQPGSHRGAEMLLSQVVAVLIERWDGLDDGVKEEMADLLRRS